MIYIQDFGWRLGNQLFQIAAGTALAKQRGDQLMIPEWPYGRHFRGPFLIGNDKAPVVYTAQNFHYEPIDCANFKKSVGINGLFQSEQYFKHCENDIRSMFTMNPQSEVFDEVNENAQAIASCGVTCSVHIRRGDYLNHPNHHPTLSPQWYQQAMRRFHPDTVFWVFSDDMAWTKTHIHAPNVCYQHSSDISDFFTMSLCNHHIIANSTFSWWAAWLNPSQTKKVVAPTQWFGPAYGHWKTDDLYPSNWVKQ